MKSSRLSSTQRPSSLDALIEGLRRLPGVGPKSAQRIACHLLQHDREGAPLLGGAETGKAMRPGSVIVDLAGEQGGNCELSVPGETTVQHDVTIIAPLHIASDLAYHASQMYAKNVAALVALLAPQGEL